MNNDTHWLTRYHRQSSSASGREAGFSVTKGCVRLTPFGTVALSMACLGVFGLVWLWLSLLNA